MTMMLNLPLAGTLGSSAGPNSDGVHAGILTPTALTAFLLSSHALPARCMTDHAGQYTDKTTAFGDATTGDVALLPSTPAANDATFFGHATATFPEIDINISTAGAGTWTIVWEYWSGSAWTALSGVTDNTTGFTAGTGVKTVTYTLPNDWVKNTVDNVLAYWVRARVSAYTSITTQPLATNGNVVSSDAGASYTDDTTDANSATAGDVALLPSSPAAGDAAHFGYSAKFCAIKAIYSQNRTGTATITWEYWNGSSWAALAVFTDPTTGWSVAAGTRVISFQPPSDWVANTTGNGPNGVAGFFIRARLSAMTSVTQQPLGSRFYVLPLTVGTGIAINQSTTINKLQVNMSTLSGSTADSVFLLINRNTGNFVAFTMTKATAMVPQTVSLGLTVGNELVIKQVGQDGSTEFAGGAMILSGS